MHPLIAVIFSLLVMTSKAPASEATCSANKFFDANLAHLLEWCEKHKVPDDQCDHFLDAAGELSEHDFRKKLYDHNHANSSTDSTVGTSSNIDWHSIPKDRSEAFKKLTEISQTPSDGFARKIEFSHEARKHSQSLNESEMKHAFEVIEKMKTSANVDQFKQYLRSKGGETLNNRDTKSCTGKNVYSVRLSLSARMCFQFDPDDSSSVRILCMGSGNRCYQH